MQGRETARPWIRCTTSFLTGLATSKAWSLRWSSRGSIRRTRATFEGVCRRVPHDGGEGGRALLERRGNLRSYGRGVQLALQDIIDILVTSRRTQPAKNISASILNSTTELTEESGIDRETEESDPSTECVKELVKVPGSDLETATNDPSMKCDKEQGKEPGTTWRQKRATRLQSASRRRWKILTFTWRQKRTNLPWNAIRR